MVTFPRLHASWFSPKASAQPFFTVIHDSTRQQIRFFITVLRQMARADPMTALLSLAVEGSMSNMHRSPFDRTFNTSATKRRLLAFDSSYSFHSQIPPIPLATQAMPRRPLLKGAPNSKLPAIPRIVYAYRLSPQAQQNTVHGPVSVHSARSQSKITPPLKIFPLCLGVPIHRAPTSRHLRQSCFPLSMPQWRYLSRQTLLCHEQQLGEHGERVTAPHVPEVVDGQQQRHASRSDSRSRCGQVERPILRRQRPAPQSSKGNMHDNSSSSTAVNNGVTNNYVYSDDSDLISGKPALATIVSQVPHVAMAACGMAAAAVTDWSGAQSPALSNTSGRFGDSDDGSSAMAAALAGFGMSLGIPGLGMPNGLNMAQLSQPNGMNLFDMNMLGMASLSARGISPEAQLLPAQITAAVGGLVWQVLQMGIMARGGPDRSSGRRLRRRTAERRTKKISTGGTERRFWVAAHAQTAQVQLNFEGMSWKEIVVIVQQALEVQGVAALGARRKMLRAFERKMVIDDPMALLPSPPPPGAPAPSSASTLG
ncbi:hypothetical protein V8E53_011553 [Lactarius tabidus]